VDIIFLSHLSYFEVREWSYKLRQFLLELRVRVYDFLGFFRGSALYYNSSFLICLALAYILFELPLNSSILSL